MTAARQLRMNTFSLKLLAVMAKSGREGMNARQIAEQLHQDAIRVRKFIADNPKLLKKTGKGAGTKFFLQ